jgi:hypothetical protein
VFQPDIVAPLATIGETAAIVAKDIVEYSILNEILATVAPPKLTKSTAESPEIFFNGTLSIRLLSTKELRASRIKNTTSNN